MRTSKHANKQGTKASTRTREDPRAGMLAALNLALEKGDSPKAITAAGALAKDYSIAKIARETGLNRAQLYRSLGENGNPGLISMMRILDVMGLQIMVRPK